MSSLKSKTTTRGLACSYDDPEMQQQMGCYIDPSLPMNRCHDGNPRRSHSGGIRRNTGRSSRYCSAWRSLSSSDWLLVGSVMVAVVVVAVNVEADAAAEVVVGR